MPKEKYSKLPVSVVRQVQLNNSDQRFQTKPEFIDPRFLNLSKSSQQNNIKNNLKNFDFINEQQRDMIKQLRLMKKRAKKNNDEETLEKVREMIGEERTIKKRIEKQSKSD
jgi:hypothetical protein